MTTELTVVGDAMIHIDNQMRRKGDSFSLPDEEAAALLKAYPHAFSTDKPPVVQVPVEEQAQVEPNKTPEAMAAKVGPVSEQPFSGKAKSKAKAASVDEDEGSE